MSPDLVSDRCPQLTFKHWKAKVLSLVLGVSWSLSSGYHPCTNGRAQNWSGNGIGPLLHHSLWFHHQELFFSMGWVFQQHFLHWFISSSLFSWLSDLTVYSTRIGGVLSTGSIMMSLLDLHTDMEGSMPQMLEDRETSKQALVFQNGLFPWTRHMTVKWLYRTHSLCFIGLCEVKSDRLMFARHSFVCTQHCMFHSLNQHLLIFCVDPLCSFHHPAESIKVWQLLDIFWGAQCLKYSVDIDEHSWVSHQFIPYMKLDMEFNCLHL